MDLVFKNGLVQFSGSEELELNGEKQFVFHFRNGAGEPFKVELKQDEVPNTAFACHDDGFFSALQEILTAQEGCLIN